MIKLFKTAIFFSLLFSCNTTTEDRPNEKLRTEIDSIKETDTIYQLRTDSIGNIIDTLSVVYQKRNQENIKMYHKNIGADGYANVTKEDYFWPDGELFFSKVTTSEGLFTTFECWKEDSLIDRCVSISYENNEILDSINLDYKHSFTDGELTQTTITNKQNGESMFFTHLIYDNSGNLKTEIELEKTDTLRITDYAYLNSLISKKKEKNLRDLKVVETNYNAKGFLLFEEVYRIENDSLFKIFQTDYRTDSQGNIIQAVETDLIAGEKTYILIKNAGNNI